MMSDREHMDVVSSEYSRIEKKKQNDGISDKIDREETRDNSFIVFICPEIKSAVGCLTMLKFWLDKI